MHIGKAIAWGRSSIGLTKAEFAKQIDCDRSWVFRLENGTSCPSHDFVENAARMFGLPNVERMKLGFLPDRLSVMTPAQLKAVGRSLKKFPNWEQELSWRNQAFASLRKKCWRYSRSIWQPVQLKHCCTVNLLLLKMSNHLNVFETRFLE